jgi:hypothetical protein
VLLHAPQEFVVALLRLLLLLLILLFVLLLKLWAWLLWLWRTKNLYEEETEEDCGRIPETLIRRPDPAIYSQHYLGSQGLPVTWNNPDIWVAPASSPGAIEPDSYHLSADTDYIVSVQAHNASTDAAIGVKVRLVYRPWSFNSPDLVPVETDAAGNEVFGFVDIAPMGSAIAQFNWHTPEVAPGETAHFCLQAYLSHPLDINPANNMGQENTNVYSQNPGHVAPGEIAVVETPLFNNSRRPIEVQFRWDAYEINQDDTVELELKTVCGHARLPLSDRLAHTLPTVSTPAARDQRPPVPDDISVDRSAAVAPRVSLVRSVQFSTPKSSFRDAKIKYDGFDGFRETILSRDYSLPPGMQIDLDEADEDLRMMPQEMHLSRVTIKVPDDAADGMRLPVNIVAETGAGVLLGGVTILFQVQV